MPTIHEILKDIKRELVPEFEEKLRAHLASQDRDWLIEQIVRLTLDAHSLEERDRRHARTQESRRREERVERLRTLGLDREQLEDFVQAFREYSRERLIEDGYLLADAPDRGGDMIPEKARSAKGNELLLHARDMLFGFLFGDESTRTKFERTQRKLLTLTVPRQKSETLDFMKASTELRATGTWQDAGSGARDVRTDNIVLEIEYGELADEMLGDGIVTALRLINLLEINEEVLYGRIEKIEQSTLVT